MTKFTFKTNKSTGLARVCNPNTIDIKIKRKKIGIIAASHGQFSGPWKISLAVKKEKTKENPAPFKWIRLNRDFDTIEEAKTCLNKNADNLIKQFDLYHFE